MKFIFIIITSISLQALSQDTLFLNNGSKFPFKDKKYSTSDNLNTSIYIKINDSYERRIININEIKYFLTRDTLMLKNVMKGKNNIEISKYRYLDTNNIHISLNDFLSRLESNQKDIICDTCKKEKIKTSIIISFGPNINLGGQINSQILDNYQISERNKFSLAAEIILGKKNALFWGAKCGYNLTNLQIQSNNTFYPDYNLNHNSIYLVMGPSYNFTVDKLKVAFKFYGGIISYSLESKIKLLDQFSDFNSNGTSFLFNPSLDFYFKLSKNISLFNSLGLQIYNTEIKATKNFKVLSDNSTSFIRQYPNFNVANTVLDYRIGLKFDIK